MAWRTVFHENLTKTGYLDYDRSIDFSWERTSINLRQYYTTISKHTGNFNSGDEFRLTAEFTVEGTPYTESYIIKIPAGTSGRSLDIYTNRTYGEEEYIKYQSFKVEEYYEYTPNPPSTPSSITVPTTIKGGESFTVSWGSSSGATRYYLERSVNGGSWTQIYQGSNRNYTDTITKGWDTVRYRVRAYNSDGYSGYRTSPTRTVINFPEFNMKIDGALKTSENGWVKIDGQLKEIDKIWTKINGLLKEV